MTRPPPPSRARPRRGRLVLAALSVALLAGCAQPPRPASGATDHWSGRLAVQVEDGSAQSFSAGFELKGSPAMGALTLFNPLGNVIAELQWSPGRAVLNNGSETRQSISLQTLVHELTGSALPIDALFGWLKGEQVQATGWQADLSALDKGRLTATRHTPAPHTVLRVILSL
ncbi:lipoprotein insertase outer membrane protein LolB [Alicycliphilus denitrificans]|uniref:lipoprotein insertase outer membrane protein LolB n=1 Tax=Alicycliphilus denitrificans TaxID=179636 RepID=UPI0038516ECC